MHDSDPFTNFLYAFASYAAVLTLIPLAFVIVWNFILWLASRPAGRVRQWRVLDEIERNLQRASHGVAYIVLPLEAVWLTGPDAVGAFLSGFAPSVRLSIIGACAIWFVTAMARCVGGWRRCAGVRDGLLAGRAFFKLAGGAGLLMLLQHLPSGLGVRNGGAAALALLLVPSWLAVTGFVRFVILVRPAGSARPEVETNIADSEFDWNG
jgi:hypothetical protein